MVCADPLGELNLLPGRLDLSHFWRGNDANLVGRWSTGRTPFFLVYGAEAEQARQDAVDLLEEEREMALIRSTIYQQDLRRFHAKNVKSRAFQEGDLVLRVDQQKPHKLAPSWEGPFIVTKVLHNGAYRLYNVEHQIDEPRAWNEIGRASCRERV